MKKAFFIVFSILAILSLSSVPLAASAVDWSLQVNCDGVNQKCGFGNFVTLLNTVLKFILIATPFLAAISFTIAGIIYATAAGDTGKIETAHSIFYSTAVGIVLVLAAWLIVRFILSGLGTKDEFDLLNKLK